MHTSVDALAASYQPEQNGKKEDKSAAAASGEFARTTSHRAQTLALAVGQAHRLGMIGSGWGEEVVALLSVVILLLVRLFKCRVNFSLLFIDVIFNFVLVVR